MKNSRLAIVLLNPLIPNNTGNIGRSALGFNTELHIIHPIGFDLSDQKVRRSGLDYWKHVYLHQHNNWYDFANNALPTFDHIALFTKFGNVSLHTHKFPNVIHNENGTTRESRIALLFGNEVEGVPKPLFESVTKSVHCRLYISIDFSLIRSYNLSNAVSIGVSECVRQICNIQQNPT